MVGRPFVDAVIRRRIGDRSLAALRVVTQNQLLFVRSSWRRPTCPSSNQAKDSEGAQ
jgi:hypothetical protein